MTAGEIKSPPRDAERGPSVAEHFEAQSGTTTKLEDFLPESLNSARQRRWQPRTRMPFAVVIGSALSALLYKFGGQLPDIGSLSFYAAGAFAVVVVYLMVGTQSPWEGHENKAQGQGGHPDPDVQAMIDGKIDAAEYRRRKEAREAASTDSESVA
jgi:hypothetical protein